MCTMDDLYCHKNFVLHLEEEFSPHSCYWCVLAMWQSLTQDSVNMAPEYCFLLPLEQCHPSRGVHKSWEEALINLAAAETHINSLWVDFELWCWLYSFSLHSSIQNNKEIQAQFDAVGDGDWGWQWCAVGTGKHSHTCPQKHGAEKVMYLKVYSTISTSMRYQVTKI